MKAFIKYIEKICGSSLDARSTVTQAGVRVIDFEKNLINNNAFAVRALIKHKVYTAWATPVATGYQLDYNVLDPEIGLTSVEYGSINMSSQLNLL